MSSLHQDTVEAAVAAASTVSSQLNDTYTCAYLILEQSARDDRDAEDEEGGPHPQK